ncbi:MAG: 2-hydroxyacyl-CoA dehydratase family protein, partial [Candidatus Aminicenantes bacterium]|nr:2-hydroxyacyl-CoA dehydratase family protein [Candidatus Aminicenantes bacterium]
TIEEMLRAVAERYFKINCSCFSPNEDRIENILNLAREFKVDGLVHYILSYCHTYNIETINIDAALKKENIPSLKIETDYSEEDTGQLRIRIEAFLEGIKPRGR